jgi:hypothetical protein
MFSSSQPRISGDVIEEGQEFLVTMVARTVQSRDHLPRSCCNDGSAANSLGGARR